MAGVVPAKIKVPPLATVNVPPRTLLLPVPWAITWLPPPVPAADDLRMPPLLMVTSPWPTVPLSGARRPPPASNVPEFTTSELNLRLPLRVAIAPELRSMDNGNAPVAGVLSVAFQLLGTVRLRELPTILTLPPVLAVNG